MYLIGRFCRFRSTLYSCTPISYYSPNIQKRQPSGRFPFPSLVQNSGHSRGETAAKKKSSTAMAYLSMGEAHRRITDYLNLFCDSVFSQDAASLKHLLCPSSNSPSLLSLGDSLNLFQVSVTASLLKFSHHRLA